MKKSLNLEQDQSIKTNKYDKNAMIESLYYDIEVGKKVEGKIVLDTKRQI